jgi:glutaconate CoA-transferase subunit A
VKFGGFFSRLYNSSPLARNFISIRVRTRDHFRAEGALAVSMKDLVAQIGNGTRLALPASRSGPAIAATKALIAHGVRDLHLIAMPTSGLQADMLIGAGCVSIVESAGITLDEFGQAPRFVTAVKAGSIKLMDTTCPALISAMQAGEKGIPFIPMRGLIGSDLLVHRPDYRVIDNPMVAGDKIVVMPAIRPDVCLFHAPLADSFGNVWIGKSRELMTMAHASLKTLVTYEAEYDGNLMDDPLYGPATIPAHYVSDVCYAAQGSWPLGLAGYSTTDADAMTRYASMAGTDARFADYMAGNSAREAAQ